MENFGSYLKTHREKKSIRLEEIASITKIHLHSLELLETSQWEQLPPEPFIRGFIIAYAKYVGLQPKDVLERYYEETGRKKSDTPQVENRVPEPASAAQTSRSPSDLIAQVRFAAPTKIVIAASIAAVIAIVTILISVGKKADHSEGVQAAATEAATTRVAASNPTTAVEPQKTDDGKGTADSRSVALASAPKTEPQKATDEFAHEIVVEGKERTWVKVVIDENPPLEFFLSEGEKATYSAKAKIKLVLGNASGSKVMHNGKPVDGTKFMGTIRSYKFPANAKFPQDAPAKRETSSTPPGGADASAGSPPADVVSPE